MAPGHAVPPEGLASTFRGGDICWDIGSLQLPRWDSDLSPAWASQRWLIGLKAPDSGVAPVMYQASRGLWEEVWRGVSSERDSIIAYAWRGTGWDTQDRQVSRWAGGLQIADRLSLAQIQMERGGQGPKDTRLSSRPGRGRREQEGRVCWAPGQRAAGTPWLQPGASTHSGSHGPLQCPLHAPPHFWEGPGNCWSHC